MEGASQILETNDSTLHQLKPSHPSHVEGPVSPRRLCLATYLVPTVSVAGVKEWGGLDVLLRGPYLQKSDLRFVQLVNRNRSEEILP